jgi:hypothetical protein
MDKEGVCWMVGAEAERNEVDEGNRDGRLNDERAF